MCVRVLVLCVCVCTFEWQCSNSEFRKPSLPQLVNDLAYHIDADEILSLAESYALQLHHSQSLPDELKALLVKGGKEELFTGYQEAGSSAAEGDS